MYTERPLQIEFVKNEVKVTMSLHTSEPKILVGEAAEKITKLIKEKTGINISESNFSALQKKLCARISSLSITEFSDYMNLLQDGSTGEMNFLLNSSTINFTSFMREKEHFHMLTDKILPDVLEKNSANKRLRIWSAACSSGEEAYTLAIVLKEALEARPGWDIRIIATDLDTDVLSFADKGVYYKKRIDSFNPIRQQKWFEDFSEGSGQVRVKKEIRDMVEFRQLNLVDNWKLFDKMDIIFCRNVLIYFDIETRGKLISRFVDQLSSKGWLVVSRTESIFGVNERLVSVGNSVYQLD